MNAEKLAIALVEHLPGWSLADDEPDWIDGIDRRHIMRAADGARLLVVIGRPYGWVPVGRVGIVGCWPNYGDGKEYYPHERCQVTCALTRSPKSIAGDVARRLLPEYDVEHAKAVAHVRKSDTDAGEAMAVAQRLALVVGGTVGENRARRGDGVRVWVDVEGIERVEVMPAYGLGELYAHPVGVEMRLHRVDPDTAARILELLAEAERPRVESHVRVSEDEQDVDEDHAANETRRRVLAR